MNKIDNYSEQEIRDIYYKSKNFADLAKNFGYKGSNGRLIKIFKQLAEKLSIETPFLNNKRTEPKDYIGQIKGSLKVIDIDKEKTKDTGITHFRCECLNCGNKNYLVSISNINKVKTCGCSHNQHFIEGHYEDLKGKTFQHLQVLEIDKETSLLKNKIYWKCKCLRCNKNIISVPSWELKNNKKDNCGCYRCNSKGEEKINHILTKLNIKFIQEYTFKDFYQIKGHYYRYDFAIFDTENNLKALIEYHGKQHYINGWVGKESLESIQTKDKKKEEYCIKNNIPLIIIPYTDLNLINEEYILNKLK